MPDLPENQEQVGSKETGITVPGMDRGQEKRELLRAFNDLTKRRSDGHLYMAVTLWELNGLQCALEFISKMKEYDQKEGQQ